ncbi:MAG: hypothetical protein GY793_11875 [Proteobacteria bacterium]|nr:hypothetical protein [Pseudomonadota bacterium]
MNSIIIKDKLTGRVVKFWAECLNYGCDGCCFNGEAGRQCKALTVRRIVKSKLNYYCTDGYIFKAKEIRR